MRKHRPAATLALLAILAFTGALAQAQTVSNGPYYATPSWDQTLSCTSSSNCPRFVVLSNFNDAAVLDRETGLVWEQSPSTALFILVHAIENRCGQLTTGGRLGWRVPRLEELSSVLDPTQFHSSGLGCGSAALPPGHPFSNVCQGLYWTVSTTGPGVADSSVVLSLNDAIINNTHPIISTLPVWCVRGGAGSVSPVTSP